MLYLKSASRRDDGAFVCTLADGDDELSVTVNAGELQSFTRFQRRVLADAGRMMEANPEFRQPVSKWWAAEVDWALRQGAKIANSPQRTRTTNRKARSEKHL